MTKTLREVCDIVGVSRRAIQGYENIGIVTATGRNERGYLLYDITTIERIKIIKLLQDVGFSVKEIKEVIDLPYEELRDILVSKINLLEKKKDEIDLLINRVNQYIDNKL